MFWRTPSPILEFCRMQNQVWMIELSCECISMLHNAWLDIPCVFLHFIEMINDKPYMKEAYPIYLWVRACHPLSRTFSCIKLFFAAFEQLHDLPPSTLLWFMLILGWWVDVHWRCELKFLLDCLVAWRRVVLLCLLVIRQPSLWSKKEPHWYLYESFISMT